MCLLQGLAVLRMGISPVWDITDTCDDARVTVRSVTPELTMGMFKFEGARRRSVWLVKL
jgi:hypothetical protein